MTAEAEWRAIEHWPIKTQRCPGSGKHAYSWDLLYQRAVPGEVERFQCPVCDRPVAYRVNGSAVAPFAWISVYAHLHQEVTEG